MIHTSFKQRRQLHTDHSNAICSVDKCHENIIQIVTFLPMTTNFVKTWFWCFRKGYNWLISV